MLKCEKCSMALKNKPKEMLPNKTFICAGKCKKVAKMAVIEIAAPSCDTIKGRQAITVCKPRNVSKEKVIPLEPIVSNIVVNAKADRKELVAKTKKEKKEKLAPPIEITSAPKNKGGRPKKSGT